MVYKMTIWKHLKFLSLYLFLFVFITFLTLHNFYGSNSSNGTFIYIIGLLTIAQIILGVYIHSSYWINNRGLRIIKKPNSVYEVHKKKKVFSFFDEDILRIEVHKTSGLLKNKIFLTSDLYFYYKVQLKSGESIIITNLLVPNIEKIFQEKIEIHKRFIATIK